MGKLPWYFNYFVHSCEYNPSVDFYIVTDKHNYETKLPDNVTIICESLEEINKRASKKLGFATRITSGYKLCDFKPAYGIIFDDIVRGYDFWAHGDIDVIFGDIRKFITDEILNSHEIISVRHDFLTGQFLLFRNDTKMNSLFRQSNNYKQVLTSDRHFCFDETNFRWQEFTDGKAYAEIGYEVESMTHLVKRLQQAGVVNPYFDFLIIEGLPGQLKWENGILTYKEKYEVLLYHLVLFKRIYQPKTLPTHLPDTFYITRDRIIHRTPRGAKDII